MILECLLGIPLALPLSLSKAREMAFLVDGDGNRHEVF